MEGYPIYHPESGVRLDWNIRVTVIGGEVIDMYVRAGQRGAAINTARGAVSKNLGDVLNSMGLNDAQKDMLRNQLADIALSLQAEAETNIVGVDFIVTPSLEPIVVEADGETAGAFNAIASDVEPLATQKAVIRAWRDSLFASQRPVQSPDTPDPRQHAQVFYPEDAVAELLFRAQRGGRIQKASVIDMANRIESVREQGEEIHPALADFAMKAAEVAGPSETAIPSFYETLSSAIADLREGNTEEAFSSLNTLTEKDWDIPITLRRIADTLLPRTDQNAVRRVFDREHSANAAQAYAQALLTRTITVEGLDPLGIGRPTTQAIHSILSQHLSRPPQQRINLGESLAPILHDLLPKEAEYIKPLIDRIVSEEISS